MPHHPIKLKIKAITLIINRLNICLMNKKNRNTEIVTAAYYNKTTAELINP
jgi:hypothetical protein